MSDNHNMNDYSLSKSQLAKLEQQHRTLRDKRQADRVKAVIALSKGFSAASIAEILLFDEKTSRNYFDRYQHGGLTALLDDNYTGAEPKLTEQQIKALETYLEDHILPDAKAVMAYIKKQYGVRYSLSGVTELLHRLSFSYKKLTHVPGKQDPAQQQAFLGEYEQLKATKDENDPLYFADATHPQHNSVPAFGWIKTGQEKELKANCGRRVPVSPGTSTSVPSKNVNGFQWLFAKPSIFWVLDAYSAATVCASACLSSNVCPHDCSFSRRHPSNYIHTR